MTYFYCGSAIKEMRKVAGITQQQLSEISGLSRTHIAALETNKYNCSIKTFDALATACGFEFHITLVQKGGPK
jgi:DNA-binding XRE family transcriptional regulator